MIPWYLIVTSGLVTAAAVALAVQLSGWGGLELWSSAPVSGVLIIGWRAFANLSGLNTDFLPAISPADLGCLIAGSIAPLCVALGKASLTRRWLPATVGGLAGFAVNVLIL